MSEETLEARWRVLAEKVIGGSLDKPVHLTPDSQTIRPLYPRRVGDGPHLWRPTGPWSIAQRVDHPAPDEANRLALLDLEGGANALTLVTTGSPYSRSFGLRPDRPTLDAALQSVELDFIAARLDAGADCLVAADALGRIIEDRRLRSAHLEIDFGFDPIGVAARSGARPDVGQLSQLLDIRQNAGIAGCPLLADGRTYHEAGANPAQELGACLATAIGYVRALETIGIDLDEARKLIAVLLVADADMFVSLAKFRAMRRLWARFETCCGQTPNPLRIHAETAWRTMSRYDVWNNTMRATAGIFAAGLGGADVVTVLPFTLVRGLPDQGARRLARNAQRVLIDESHLDAVDDPSAGSGAFEALTDELCELAWTVFQDIERDGGIIASFDAGHLRSRIAETAKARAGALASLQAGLVGVNRFPSVHEASVSVIDVGRRPERKPDAAAFPSMRDAEPFEDLRDGVEAMDSRPSVFLAAQGSPASFGPRVSYATNFFAVAGIGVSAASSRDIDENVAAFRRCGTPVACICAPPADASRDDAVRKLATALRDSGAAMILSVADSDTMRDAGVDDLIHDGCDALAILAKVVEAASSAKS